MNTLETIQTWLDDEYNNNMSAYIREGKVTLTNGSSAFYINIWKENNRLKIVGSIYGKSVNKEAQNNRQHLMGVLAQTI